jgi:hypothetical protein
MALGTPTLRDIECADKLQGLCAGKADFRLHLPVCKMDGEHRDEKCRQRSSRFVPFILSGDAIQVTI